MGMLPTHKKNVYFSWAYPEDLVTALGKPPLRGSAHQAADKLGRKACEEVQGTQKYYHT